MRTGQGREVVIVEAARTPIGRGHLEKGYYKNTHPNELLGAAYRAVVERAGVDPAEVENVIAGCVAQFGPQGLHVGRNAWLQARSFPIETSATTIDLQVRIRAAGGQSRRIADRLGRSRCGDRRWSRAHGQAAVRRDDED